MSRSAGPSGTPETLRTTESPLLEEGFFDGGLPTFDNNVHTVISEQPELSQRGWVYPEIYVMEDGTRYRVVTGVPDHQDSDTLVAFTTAWLTATKGHNRRTLLRAMKAGYTSVMMGPEEELRNEEKPWYQRISEAPITNPYKVISDYNRILDVAMSSLLVNPNELIVLGESRAAMKALGLNEPTYSGDRFVVYGDLTAPCFRRKPKVKELPSVAAQLVPEAATLGKLALRMVRKPVARHYRGTVPGDPEYYLKETLKIPILMSGFAGKIAASSMKQRPKTPLHVRVFDGDRWSQAAEWVALYEPYPSVTIEHCRGNHLDIASEDTLDNIELRLTKLRQMRGKDGSYDNVDFDAVKSAHIIDDPFDDRRTLPVAA